MNLEKKISAGERMVPVQSIFKIERLYKRSLRQVRLSYARTSIPLNKRNALLLHFFIVVKRFYLFQQK